MLMTAMKTIAYNWAQQKGKLFITRFLTDMHRHQIYSCNCLVRTRQELHVSSKLVECSESEYP